MQIQTSIQPGFHDPVRNAQSVFRSAMDAMAQPGRRFAISTPVVPPGPLSAPMGAMLLTLCDFETSVWLDAPLADTPGVREFVRFHTGARIVTVPTEATFAVISDAMRMPTIGDFAQGTPEYPDRSTTIIIGVRMLQASGWKLEGPGIRGYAHFSAAPLPGDFIAQMRANRARFPMGADVFLASDDAIAALPRSTTLTEGS